MSGREKNEEAVNVGLTYSRLKEDKIGEETLCAFTAVDGYPRGGGLDGRKIEAEGGV